MNPHEFCAIKPINHANGKVDLLVTTKDVWTLSPGFSVSRKGGENKTTVDVEEVNLLGRGQLIRFARTDNVDRITKSVSAIAGSRPNCCMRTIQMVNPATYP